MADIDLKSFFNKTNLLYLGLCHSGNYNNVVCLNIVLAKNQIIHNNFIFDNFNTLL